jgi:hypothetical protein
MASFSVELQGMKEVLEAINPARIPKQVALAVGISMKKLHADIEHEVFARYKVSKKLSSVLIGGSISNVTFGKNVIKGGLQYSFQPIGLASFFSPPTVLGNINPGARRKGRIHSVEVIRGQRKIVYGKKHYGGFIPLGWKSPMFERATAKRFPIDVLYAPTLSQMAGHVIDNSSFLQYEIDNIAETINNHITF